MSSSSDRGSNPHDPRPAPGAVEADVIRSTIEANLFARAEGPVRIEHFVVLGKAGSGAMGIVYRAYDPELQREVALKLVRPELVVAQGFDSGQAMERLLLEARTAARVNHPNVGVVHQVGMHADDLYIAMEFIDGVTLRRWCAADPPRGWREVLDIFLAVGEGLAAAHRVGVVHRDFKPDNVLVGKDDRPRVVDFGLALAAADPTPTSSEGSTDRDAQTWTHALRGTPAYMSPEHHRGEARSEHSDQFSYCVALWEALSGERPYAGETRTELQAAVTELRRRPFACEGAPKSLVGILERGLEPDPGRRFGSMDGLLDALRKVARPRPSWAGRTLVLATAASVAGVLVLAREDPTAACESGAQRVAEVWGDAQRTRLEQAFSETDLDYAITSATRAAELLDAFAEDWRAAYRSVCSNDVRGVTTPDNHRRRMACLDDGLDALDAFVGELFQADSVVLTRAVPGAVGLPAPERCSQGQHLPSVGHDDDPERAAVRRDVYRELARARGLALAGRKKRTLDAARQAADSASQLGDGSAEAATWHYLGHRLAIEGSPEARTALERGFQAALRVGDDLQAARIAIAMIQAVDKHAESDDEAQRWSGRAESLIARLGGDPMLEVDRLQQMGENAGVRREAATALEYFEAAWQLARQEGLSREVHAALRVRLAKAHLGTGSLETAEANARAALTELEDMLGPDHPRIADIHTLLGMLAGRRGRLERAYEHYAKAVQILDAAGTTSEGAAGTHANLGSAARALGRNDEARRELQLALTMFESSVGPDHRTMPTMLVMAAQLEVAEGDMAAAEVLFERAAKHPSGVSRDHALEGLAQVYDSRGEFTLALSSTREALEIRREAGRMRHVAFSEVTVAQLLLKLERLQQASAAAEAALATIASGEAEDPLATGRARVVLAEVRLQQRRTDDARSELDAALEAWANPPQPPAEELAHARVLLASVLHELEDPARADALSAAKQALTALDEPDPGDRAILDALAE